MAKIAGLGVISAGLNISITVVLHEILGVMVEVSFLVGISTVMIVNFFAARSIFRAQGGDSRRQFVMFVISSLCFRGGQYLSFLALHTWLGIPYLLAIIVVLGAFFLFKFFFFRDVVFAPRQAADAGR